MTKSSSQIQEILDRFEISPVHSGTSTGVNWHKSKNGTISSRSPINGEIIADVEMTSVEAYESVVKEAQKAFEKWRMVPAPQRGEIVRQIGLELRKYKNDLGMLVTYEMGKSIQEGLGEVQEMIDICDFAVGLSRQLHGLTMHSERPHHRMYEQYHPLGIVGIISAFNFPVAVWSWNTMISWVCGDVAIWKPSEKVPLCAIACQKIVAKVFAKNNIPEGVSNILIGDYTIGQKLAADGRVPLISATGSTRMGKLVGQAVGSRLGKSILDLGGNYAIIMSVHAVIHIALTSAVLTGGV